MAKQECKNSKTVEEEDVQEDDKDQMADLNTICSESTFEAETPEAVAGGGPLSPEGEGSSLLLSEEACVGPDGSHTVTCTFTVSLAVPALPTGQMRKKSNLPDMQGERMQADESGAVPSTQRFYHIEYFLLPDDLVPRQVNLGLFGVAAQLFTESGSKAITPWFEDDKMWISWNHSVDIAVTSEYLIKLKDHKIILKILDTKDKAFSKMKLSKPKVVSSLEEDTEALAEVKHAVLLQRKLFEESQPAPSCTKIRPAKKILQTKAQEDSSALPVEAEETELNGLETSNCDLPPASRTDNFCSVRSEIFERNRFLDEAFLPEQNKTTTKGKGASVPKGGSVPKRRDAAVARNIASLQLNLLPLLAGEKSVISRLAENNPEVLDAYLTFTVETPLLSERQKHELNPLVIRIKSATCLPNTPVPVELLQRLCVPTYCKYKFHNFPPHRTHGQVHGTHVYFKDVNVLLTGTMAPGELQRYLRGPPLEIEVHDRDRKMKKPTKKPCLFGEDEADEEVGKVSFLACTSTICNSFMENKLWHPHGVAKISLTDLLLGRKYLAIRASVHNCSVPDTAVFSMGEENGAITESVSNCSPLPMGHYLESDSLLKVRVEIAVPLGMDAESDDAQATNCPYGYIIYVFDYKNSSLLYDLVKEITEINAEALQLDCYPLHSFGMALAALKLQTTLEEVSELDIVTGFHLVDGATHLFVLEGLKDKAIKKLWDKHFERTHRHGQLKILYNSGLSFPQRLYTELKAIFYHWRLCQPLFTIAKQPLLYVRGIVPRACFQALSRLSYLCQSKRLRDVICGDLLPSAEMVTALSAKYGVPLADEDLFPQKPPSLSLSSDDYAVPGKVRGVKQAVCVSLDNDNEKCVQRKEEIARKTSFERSRRAAVGALCQLKGKTKKPKFETFRISPVDGKSVFNYSCQSLNSAELAKKHLRQELAKEPKKIFTYCPEYLSATFEPVDVVAASMESSAKSKSMWLSPEGFVVPGLKSSIRSTLQPLVPGGARREELRKNVSSHEGAEKICRLRVREANQYHVRAAAFATDIKKSSIKLETQKWQDANVEPVLSRDRWSWDKRHIDFELYKKPPELFMTTAPLTDTRQIVRAGLDGAEVKAPRCPAAAEFRARGPRAGLQLQHLRGLPKGEPLESSVRKAGAVLKKAPSAGAGGGTTPLRQQKSLPRAMH